MTNTPLAITTAYDPTYSGTGKIKVQLTVAEETTYAAAFISCCEHGFGDLDAGRVAWELVQEQCPRLRAFDAPERSLG